MALHFVLPEGSVSISGGHIYNRALLAELRHCCALDVCSFAQWRQQGQADAGVYLFDSLDLSETVSQLHRKRSSDFWILIVHHLPSLEPGLPPDHPMRQIESTLLPQFDGFVVTSPFTKRWLTERGVPAGRIMQVQPGLDLELSSMAQPDSYSMPLIVANVIPRKGIEEFLVALESVVLPADRFLLRIVGSLDLEVQYAQRCMASVGHSLSDKVVFAGAVPHNQMPSYYRSSSLVVSAAKMETFGMALQEARAAGIPIFACRGGHVGEHLASPGAGRLFDSIEALAMAVLEVMRDPALGERCFREAQAVRTAAQFTWGDAARCLVEQLAERGLMPT